VVGSGETRNPARCVAFVWAGPSSPLRDDRRRSGRSFVYGAGPAAVSKVEFEGRRCRRRFIRNGPRTARRVCPARRGGHWCLRASANAGQGSGGAVSTPSQVRTRHGPSTAIARSRGSRAASRRRPNPRPDSPGAVRARESIREVIPLHLDWSLPVPRSEGSCKTGLSSTRDAAAAAAATCTAAGRECCRLRDEPAAVDAAPLRRSLDPQGRVLAPIRGSPLAVLSSLRRVCIVAQQYVVSTNRVVRSSICRKHRWLVGRNRPKRFFALISFEHSIAILSSC
jgi:hypothetical protein